MINPLGMEIERELKTNGETLRDLVHGDQSIRDAWGFCPEEVWLARNLADCFWTTKWIYVISVEHCDGYPVIQVMSYPRNPPTE